MRRHMVRVWAVLVLLPAIPVLLFYAVFANQNFFDLTNAARGITATGPIAAYFALVWLGWRIYKQVSSLIAPLSPFAERLVDTTWHFVAHSLHETYREGSFGIADGGHGELLLLGTFEDGNKHPVGSWRSTMARAEDQELQVVYSLNDLARGSLETSTGMMLLHMDADNRSQMNGTWVVLGRAGAQGDIECFRGPR